MADTIWVVQTTLPGEWKESQVGAWSSDLVGAGFAACVQFSSINSIFRWQGKIDAAQEWRIQLKTGESSKSSLLDEITANHPYETPQILSWKAEANKEYVEWVNE